ncbi:MAG: hypothetical protein HRT90_00660 [Candidatus Margulisbacteria bacterium]|nr:hypothetical protein [Candidatus Margulisiibacteriota bacterium]
MSSPLIGISGSLFNRKVHISNPTNKYIPVRLSIKKSRHTLNGKEVLAQTDRVAIFPNKLLLRPGESVDCDLTWLNAFSPFQEQAFQIVTDELTIPKRRRSAHRMAVVKRSQKTRVFITPSGTRPKITLKQFKKIYRRGKPKIELRLVNHGTAHLALNHITLNLKVSRFPQTPITYQEDEFTQVEILPGDTRKVILPWPYTVPSRRLQNCELVSVKGPQS